MSYKENINKLFKKYFPKDIFTIVSQKPTKGAKFQFQIGTGNQICLRVRFFTNYIYILYLSKCKIKGLETLKKIEKIGIELNNINYISLEDESTVQIYPDLPFKIDLGILKILTNGKSWYNSLEYFSNEYYEEVEHNKMIINMTLSTFQEKIIQLNIDLYAERMQPRDKIEIFLNSYFEPYEINLSNLSTLFPDIFSDDETIDTMTVQRFYNKIMTIIQRDEPDEKKGEWLSKSLEFVKDSYILNYRRDDLRKYIRGNRTDGGAIKRKQRKKTKRFVKKRQNKTKRFVKKKRNRTKVI